MNSRHRKTLSEVFQEPPPRNIAWRRVEALLRAIGCECIEGGGSRLAFKFGDLRIDLHRPHPGNEAKPYQLRALKEFLTRIGITP